MFSEGISWHDVTVTCLLSVRAGRDIGNMSADQSQHNSKRRKTGSSKKGKKQKKQDKKAARTNINDWSSDDSDEAAPAPMTDQLDSMSDSDDDNNREAAAAAATAAAAAKASKAGAESVKGQKNGKPQKAGDKKRKGGSNKGKERKSTGKETAAAAQVTDWTSDDSSDAEPTPLPDQLDSMSDSDPDTQAAGRHRKAVVGRDSATAKQAGKQHRSSHRSQSPDDLPAALGQGSHGMDASPPGGVSDSEHQQHAKRAKRKGRLRKARASPGQGQQADAATPEADDIMVELEDDVPGLEAAPEAGSNDVGQQMAAARTRPEQAEHMGSKRKSKGGESSKDR